MLLCFLEIPQLEKRNTLKTRTLLPIALVVLSFAPQPVHATDSDGLTLSITEMRIANNITLSLVDAPSDIVIALPDPNPNDDILFLGPRLEINGPHITVADICPPYGTPEPSSASLLAMTGIGLWLRRRRR